MLANILSFESKFPGWYNNLRERQKVKYKTIVWSKKGVVNYLSDLEKWYDDNVGFRNEMVKLNSIGYRCLNTSQDKNKYIVGKNDFLFIGDKLKNAVSESTGALIFSAEELQNYYGNLAEVIRYFKSKKIPVYIAIPPNKHTIYSEYLPDYLNLLYPTKYDQIIEYLGNPLNIIDLRAPILNEKAKYDDLMFYKADSHWSKLGAYLGYLEIMKKISADYPQIQVLNLKDFEVIENQQGGDLAYNANLMNWVNDFTINLTLNQPLDSLHWIESNEKFKTTGPDELVTKLFQKVTIKNKKKPFTLLYLRDSFGKNLGYFLHHTFGTVVYVYALSGEADRINKYIEKYSPDIVLFEFVERYLDSPILNPEIWFNKEACDTAESLIKLKGKDILNYTNHRVNFKVIREGKNLIEYENVEWGGSRLYFKKFDLPKVNTFYIMAKIFAPQKTVARLFYSTKREWKYNKENSMSAKLKKGWNNIFFKIDDQEFTGRFRLDPGYNKGTYKLESIELKYANE